MFQMFSSQFNFTRTFLNSFVTCFLGLTHLLNLLSNTFEKSEWTVCMSVVSVLTVYLTSLYGDHVLCLHCLRVTLISEGKSFFKSFPPVFFPKKMDSHHKKRKQMSWRQVWREDDVRRQTSDPPHLTTWRQTRQLRTPDRYPGIRIPGKRQPRCLHTVDAGSLPPVVSWLCGLSEKGQWVDQRVVQLVVSDSLCSMESEWLFTVHVQTFMRVF